MSCPAVYINCCIDIHNKRLFKQNAELSHNSVEDIQSLRDHDCIEVVAIKDIEEGEEIFINYVQSEKYEDIEDWFKLGVKTAYIDVVSVKNGKRKEIVSEIISESDTDSDESSIKESEEEFEINDYDMKAFSFLENFKESDPSLYLIGSSLWERYKKLRILDSEKHADVALESLKSIDTISNEVYDAVHQIISNERIEEIDYDIPFHYMIREILEDNQENREFARKLTEFANKKKQASTLNDQNYENSKGGKMFIMQSKKEIGMIKTLDFIEKIYKICWPTYTSDFNTLIWSLENTDRQGFHTEYNNFGGKFKQMSYASFLSLADNNYLWFAKTEGDEFIYERVYYPFGSMIIVTGNCIHAGPEFTKSPNLRIFRYIESPTMIHQNQVTQDFQKYADYTVQLNTYK